MERLLQILAAGLFLTACSSSKEMNTVDEPYLKIGGEKVELHESAPSAEWINGLFHFAIRAKDNRILQIVDVDEDVLKSGEAGGFRVALIRTPEPPCTVKKGGQGEFSMSERSDTLFIHLRSVLDCGSGEVPVEAAFRVARPGKTFRNPEEK